MCALLTEEGATSGPRMRLAAVPSFGSVPFGLARKSPLLVRTTRVRVCVNLINDCLVVVVVLSFNLVISWGPP